MNTEKKFNWRHIVDLQFLPICSNLLFVRRHTLLSLPFVPTNFLLLSKVDIIAAQRFSRISTYQMVQYESWPSGTHSFSFIVQLHCGCSAVFNTSCLTTCFSLHLFRRLSALQQITCSLFVFPQPKTSTLALIYYSKCFAAASVAACLSLCVSLMMKRTRVLGVIHGYIIQTAYWASESQIQF